MPKQTFKTESSDLETAVKAVRAAGTIVRQGFFSNIDITVKSDQTLVTEYDHRAEQTLIELLTAETPYSILSEEKGSREKPGDHVWIMDPIDGTSNFSNGLDMCAVSLALFEHGHPQIAVVYAPIRDEMYYAERGKGAYCNQEPIHVSQNSDAQKSIMIIESGHCIHSRHLMSQVWNRLAAYDIRLLGSTAYELCCVANGKADAFVCAGDELWDFAAGMLMVTEAGGRFCDWTGQPWQRDNPHIYASNSHIDDLILPNIQDLQQ